MQTSPESKWTKGAWKWDFGIVPPDGPGRYADIYADSGDVIIAHFNDQIPEGIANAHLIASAPDMAEALEAAPIRSKYHGVNGFEEARFFEDYDAFTAKRRAALAKAEGR